MTLKTFVYYGLFLVVIFTSVLPLLFVFLFFLQMDVGVNKLWWFWTCYFLKHSCLVQTFNFTQSYYDGRTHYLDEEWGRSIDSFEELVMNWKKFNQKMHSCRRRCASEPPAASDENETFIQIAACQLQCRPHYICDKTVETHLRRNMPYNYLQLAYYK